MKIFILSFLAILSQCCIHCTDLSESSQNDTINALGLLTVRGVLKHAHVFNRELIERVLKELSRDPNSPLAAIMPDAKRIILATHDRIDQCYDSSIGDSGELVDIFNEPLGAIVLRFVNAYKGSLADHTYDEFKQRVKTLLSNIIFLAGRVLKCAFNSDPNHKSTKLGLTPFAIYTHEEFLDQYGGNTLLDVKNNESDLDEEQDGDESADLNKDRLGLSSLPSHFKRKTYYDPHHCKLNVDPAVLKKLTSFDWREKGVVTEVRNQQGCKSCYIFSAVGTLESAYMLQVSNKSLVRFSEQQFVDCVEKGCGGGNMPRVWDASTLMGVALADKYPHKYMAEVLECKIKEAPVFAKTVNYCQINYLNRDEQLMAMIYQYGPTAIAIDASSVDLQYLRNSPWNEPCGTSVNHAVIAVGWNEQYWIIKNSWGPDWGIKGYLYMAKNQTDTCGIYNQAGVPFFREVKQD